jgi:hypothetical protein
MADIDRFSKGLIELAERFADVTNAAQGRGNRRGTTVRARWLVLPAAGAGFYALVANGSFKRQAKTVVNQAKDRASDLPDDLLGRIQQAMRSGDQAESADSRADSSSASGTGSNARARSSTRSQGATRRATRTRRKPQTGSARSKSRG